MESTDGLTDGQGCDYILRRKFSRSISRGEWSYGFSISINQFPTSKIPKIGKSIQIGVA